MAKSYHWGISIVLALIIVCLEAGFYGFFILKPLLEPLYGGVVYVYGYGSFLALVIFSAFIPVILSALMCRLLLALSASGLNVIAGGFLIFFWAGVFSSFSILLPEYVADFGATWTTSEVIMVLILGKEYVVPFFLIVSLSGGLVLARFRVSL